MGSSRSSSAVIEDITQLVRGLPEEAAQSVLEYAQFLANKQPQSPAKTALVTGSPHSRPLDIERPAHESVVQAIQRLVNTYPMVDKDDVFEQTSNVMTAHLLQNLPASEAIDKLQLIFIENYAELIDGQI